MTNYKKRRDNLRRSIRKENVDGLLITNFLNVTYLTGFTGDDSYLLVTPDGETLLSDPRYTTQLEEECPKLKLFIREQGQQMLSAVVHVLGKAKLKRLGVESASMTLDLHRSIDEELPKVELVPTTRLVEDLRMIKDRSEIEETRQACRYAERAFEVVRAVLTPEMTERDVAAQLEYQARRFGAKGLSFPPIVAVGPRAALPHANPTDKKIGSDDFTLVDWGAYTGLYMSDLTRLIVTGKISPKLRKIYGVVLKAQLAAIDAIRPGRTCEQVDRVARRIITKAGFGKEFGHGLGHGLGLEIHEDPRLAVNRTAELRPGMIVTVEPGIYLPGWGGVRIEDDVLVTRNGREVLSNVPKLLDECLLG
jgi:Xaa-Pro aminopeptidase